MVGAAAVCACAAIWVGDPTTPGGFLPLCPTKALLGVDCPGCGSLRMIYSLLRRRRGRSEVQRSGVVALGFLVVAYATWTYGRVVGRQIVGWQHHRWAAAVTLVLVSTWFVVRNIPVAPFTSLRV